MWDLAFEKRGSRQSLRIYTAEGSMSSDIGFNFAVNPTWDADDAVRINIPCGD